MGLFSNPLSYAGYGPGVTGTPTTQNTTVRAATLAEANAGVLEDVYISPSTQAAAVAVDFASPPVLGFGSTTPRPVATTGITMSEGANIIIGTATGTKIGTATSQKIGFYNATPVVRQTQGAIVNSVTAGGTTGTIANYADLTTYATDAAAIRNDIYQLALGLQGCIAALRTYGLLG